jgi:4-hydroxybenzoate polyprenyltransferase
MRSGGTSAERDSEESKPIARSSRGTPPAGRAALLRYARAYAALTRLYTVVPLALLSFGIGIATGGPAPQVLATAIAIACAVAGGFTYNDLRDQAADRFNRPGRPLVTGLVGVRAAERLVAALFGVSVVLAVTTRSAATVVFVVLLIVAARSYSDYIKRVAGLKNAFVGFWSGLLPWGAALDDPPLATLLSATLIVALFVTQKELVADVYDRDGDAAGGVTTLAVVFGPGVALGLVAALNVTSLLVVRSADTSPLVVHIAAGGAIAATVNLLALCFVFLKTTPATVRAYLELQKAIQIGGCIVLFALLVA